jgi:hypothetical protein
MPDPDELIRAESGSIDVGGADAPIYFWRYFKPYVARFCTQEDADRFADGATELGQIWVEPHGPRDGIGYEDIGHEHCFGSDCGDDDE